MFEKNSIQYLNIQETKNSKSYLNTNKKLEEMLLKIRIFKKNNFLKYSNPYKNHH
jgi:hypothetical protein